MATIERDTITLHYDDTGSGAPPLLLVHGFGGNRGEWAAQVAHFTPRHRVVALDRRGHGASSAPIDADYSIAAYADELAGVSDELGLAPAVVVVHSFDRIAIDFALRYPERTAGIVSVDGPTAAGEPFRQAALGFQQGLSSPAWREAIRGFAEAMIFAEDMPVERREAVLAARYAVPVEVLRASWDSFVAYDEEASLAQLDLPDPAREGLLPRQPRAPARAVPAGPDRDLDRAGPPAAGRGGRRLQRDPGRVPHRRPAPVTVGGVTTWVALLPGDLRPPRLGGGRAHQPALVGEHDRLDTGDDAELGEHPIDVRLHGRLGDHQLGGDVVVGQPTAISTSTCRSRSVSCVEPVVGRRAASGGGCWR